MNRSENRRRGKRRYQAARNSASPAAARQSLLDTAMQHHAAGRLAEAEQAYRQMLDSDPTDPPALHFLGVIAHQRGDGDAAVDLIETALRHAPGDIEIEMHLGIAYLGVGRLEDAASAFLTVLSARPVHAEAHHNLARVRERQGRMEEAVASYRDAVTAAPQSAELHIALGNALRRGERLEEAVASYREALSIKPDSTVAYVNIGNIYGTMGRLDDAAASFRQAVTLEPGFAQAHRHLSLVKKFRQYDDDVKAMEKQYAAPSSRPKQRMHLGFALAKAHEDLGHYEKSFQYLLEANTTKRRSFEFDIEDAERRFRRLTELFEPSLYARLEGSGAPDTTPLFIVGMPRSGTTLVEQILSSHPEVRGAGDLPWLKEIIEDEFGAIDDDAFYKGVRLADNETFSGIGQRYVQKLHERSDGAPFVTDKMPFNFQFVGMINLILPNAKIVHCRRDPLDTCLSIFKNYFSEGNLFAYDLAELGRFYGLYRRVMAHWETVLPGRVFDIGYEDLVSDQEPSSRALLDHCGLDWNDACLAFHKTDRTVVTNSSAQVRKPIYRDSVRSWTRYEAQLAPLIKALDL